MQACITQYIAIVKLISTKLASRENTLAISKENNMPLTELEIAIRTRDIWKAKFYLESEKSESLESHINLLTGSVSTQAELIVELKKQLSGE